MMVLNCGAGITAVAVVADANIGVVELTILVESSNEDIGCCLAALSFVV